MIRALLGSVCLLLALLPASVGSAQSVEMIEGNVLSHFTSTDGWSTVASVAAVDDEMKFVTVPQDGQGGILSNGVRKNKSAYLQTIEKFGDVAVSLEFMVPKDSNAGIYLMGRYEIQILDSFGIESPSFSDLGGVYQRWDEKQKGKARGFEGIAPRVNAAKPPGQWQTLDIVFRAPRFDAERNKTENARFVSVHVNGVQVQDNAEATGPTRAHPLNDEAATGPICIQGNHGPIAIRRYSVNALNSESSDSTDVQ